MMGLQTGPIFCLMCKTQVFKNVSAVSVFSVRLINAHRASIRSQYPPPLKFCSGDWTEKKGKKTGNR